jgi:hypothetical protein
VAVSDVAARQLGAPGGINNTAYLFFVLALAFLFYVTVRGDLPKWLGLLGLGKSSASSLIKASPQAAATSAASNGNFLGSAVPDVLAGAAPTAVPLPQLGSSSTQPVYEDTTSGF